MKDIFEQCNLFCNETYLKSIKEFLTNKQESEDNFRKARKYAIARTFKEALNGFPNVAPSYIWKRVNIAHVYSYVSLEIEPSVVDLILSARQSWVKSSGHAFEEMIKEECNKHLQETDARIILQRDLTQLLKKNMISNFQEDIDWLTEECAHAVFDLFVGRIDSDGKYKIFGCIQAKTSVRERVTRDREPSLRAMARKFWSIIIILDAEFLHQPKFVSMVNGGCQEFEENGWHSAYSYEEGFNNDRINYIGRNFEALVKDIKQAELDFNGEKRTFITTKYPKK